MPAPSPARGSAPTAPRCSRLSRMVSASSTILCDLRPLMSAMKPTPQESFSCAGSNSPKPCGPKPCALIVILALPRRGLCPCRGVEHTSLPRAGPLPSQPPAAEKDYGSGARGRAFFLEATFVPPGDLPRPAVPGCLSAALRRALALGGWPPRVFARADIHSQGENKEENQTSRARFRPPK